jgi:hypothetical protein
MSCTTRRRWLALASCTSAGLLLPGGALAQAARPIHLRPAARVIVDNDFAGDPDGLIALAHQLLSPTAIVPLISCSALDPRLAGAALAGRSAAEGARLVAEMIGLMQAGDGPPVLTGAEDFGAGPSAAARAIVAEAMRDDPLPLIVTCGGPLTNVAAALRLEPAIAARMTIIWIGGTPQSTGGGEYNLDVDTPAARFVIDETAVPLWQVPQPAYRQLQFGMAEMELAFRPLSPLTRWLYERYTTLPDWVQLGGALAMGDTPLVLLSAVSADSSTWRDVPVRAGRTVRMYDQLDARLALADMLARFRLHAGG